MSGSGGFGKSSASSGLLLPNEKRLFIHLCLRKITSEENKMKHILIQVKAVLLLKGVQRPACLAGSQRLALHSFQNN